MVNPATWFGQPSCPRGRKETQASCTPLHTVHPQVTALVAAQNSAEFRETKGIIKLCMFWKSDSYLATL